MGIFQLGSASYTTNEGAGFANVTVLRYENLSNKTTVIYTTLPGSAQDFIDYKGTLYGLVTFNPGDSLKTIQVPIVNDNVAELDESFSVAIGDSINNYVAPGQQPDVFGAPRTAIVTIKDNDLPTGETVEFSKNNFTVIENQGQAVITVTKKPSNTTATVSFRTQDNYAKSVTTKPEYIDYTGVTRTLTFAPQETIKTVTIPIVNDNLPETPETFNLVLSNAVGTSLGLQNKATVTINNDDSLPGVFTKEVITTGLTKPSGFAWGADQTIYISEVGGKVKIFDQKTKTLLSQPFIDLSNKVNIAGQRGLLSFAIDPNFPAKPYLYLGYTYDAPGQTPDAGTPRTNRLVRITADAATNYSTAVPNSEKLLIEVPNGYNFHASAGIAFGKDGSLFWGHGDGAAVAAVNLDPANFDNLNYPFGKLYRIDPATGKGYANNPFYDGNPDTFRSKVYSYGFRNPFRITIHPTTGEPYIGDVGWDNWEEVNTGRGKNFGWALYEGGYEDGRGVNIRTPAYANDPKYQSLYDKYSQVTPPLYARNHRDGFYSIVMGPFYNSNVYPSIFKDALFIGNFNGRTIEALNFDTTGTKIENAIQFGFNVDVLPTQLSLGPDGLLYATDFNYTQDGASSLVRWMYDAARPKITINDATITEGNTGTTTARFLITLDTKFSQPVRADFLVSDLVATSPSDYQASSGQITFAPGTTVTTLNVLVRGDTQVEPNENFLVRLRNPVNGVFARSAAVGTILNDDNQPTQPAIRVSDAFLREGNTGTTSARFLVSLDSASTQNVTVNFSTANLTALTPADYLATSGIVTFAPGNTLQTINVSVVGDTLVEADETFRLNFVNPLNATLIKNSGLGTIINDDGLNNQPRISINDTFVLEGNSGTTIANFPVSLDKPSTQPITVRFLTANQSASTVNDYLATSGILTFAPGTTSRTIGVTINGDALVEPIENFRVSLSNPVNGTLARTPAIGTIYNDDRVQIFLGSDLSITEGQSGVKNADFVIRLSNLSVAPVTVTASIGLGRATPGSDYNDTTKTITFAPYTRVATFQVPIIGDRIFERNEEFYVKLSNAVGGTITKGQVTGVIVNDDPKPVMSIRDATVIEGNSGTTEARFTVSLSNPSSQITSTVAYTTEGSAVSHTDAVSKADFVNTNNFISFAPGETLKTFNVQVYGDTRNEGNEIFQVILSEIYNADPGDITGVGNIINDDSSSALVGKTESFTLGDSTNDLSRVVSSQSLSTSIGSNAPSSKVLIPDLTPPDIFASDVHSNHLAI